MGKFFILIVFDGEFILISFFDKIQGMFILLRGIYFYFYLMSLNVKKYFEVYYIEMSYLN